MDYDISCRLKCRPHCLLILSPPLLGVSIRCMRDVRSDGSSYNPFLRSHLGLRKSDFAPGPVAFPIEVGQAIMSVFQYLGGSTTSCIVIMLYNYCIYSHKCTQPTLRLRRTVSIINMWLGSVELQCTCVHTLWSGVHVGSSMTPNSLRSKQLLQYSSSSESQFSGSQTSFFVKLGT